jgi:hypothetical protein
MKESSIQELIEAIDDCLNDKNILGKISGIVL